MLETYQMTLYKSLVFKDASDALPTILRCLEADVSNRVISVVRMILFIIIICCFYIIHQIK